MIEPFYNSLWVILEWQNILAMLVGVIGGIIFGAIPGLTATMGIALLIPLTFGMSPLMALGMMAGIHNGGSYGGAIPAVLLRIPGTPGAIATTFDGYPMAQQGLAERALKIACVSSAVGGMVSAVSLMTLSPPLAEFALAFGPPEIFWISLFGLSSIAVLLGSDPIKGLMASCVGLLLGMVGLDHVTGYERFTFDTLELSGGLQLIVIMVGVYALPPAFQMAERAIMTGVKSKDLEFEGKSDMANWPWMQIFPAWIRANVIGIIIGILPGVGGVVGAFVAYNETKRSSKDPESFGKGNPVGVAVAECANNADNAAAMIPALTLGVPGSGLAALILAGLLIHGLEPGPRLFKEAPDVVYGYMWAMLFTSASLFVFGGIIATKLFANILRLAQVQLMPVIIALTVVGIYSFENSIFNVYLMLGFGLFGYAMERLKFPIAPLILGLILGPKVEFNLRVALRLSQDDWSILWTRPISIALIILTALVLAYPLISALLRRNKEGPEEEFALGEE